MTNIHYKKVVTDNPSSNTLNINKDAEIRVFFANSGSLAVIYSDRFGGTIKSNPFNAADGVAEFYVAPGIYDVRGYVGGELVFTDDDVLLAEESAANLSEAVSAEFATVATMTSGTSLNLGAIDFAEYVGRTVRTVWNNTTSKAGGAEYVIKTDAQRIVDGDIIDGYGNHYLLGGSDYCAIILEDDLDFYHFGAIGDNLNGSPLSGADDTAAVQAALNHMVQVSKVMTCPKGRFSVSGVSATGDDWTLKGFGEGASILSQRVAVVNPLLVSGNRWRLEGIEIDGNGLGNFGVGGNPITMKNGDVGILVGASSDARIAHCAVHDCTNLGIGVRTPTSPSSTSRITIEYNHVYAIGARKTGALVGGAGGNCIAVGDTAFKNPPTIIKPTVRGNICHNSHSTLISMGSCDDFRCEGNLVFDSDSNGIQVGTGTRNGVIDGNFIRDLTGFGTTDVENRGISVDPSGSVEKQIAVRNNHIIGSQLYGIDVRVPGMLVENNIIIDNGVSYAGSSPSGLGGIAVFVGSAVISGNQIINSIGNGILCFVGNSNLSSLIIKGNRIQTSGQTGIAFNRAAGKTGFFEQPLITGNFVDGTTNGSGISLTYTNRPTVTSNVVKNASSSGFHIVATTTECIFGQNTAIGSGSNDIYLDATSTIKLSTHNEYTTSTFLGTILGPPNPIRFPAYVVASLPSASVYTNGVIIVTNEVGGRTLATSDGTNWRRVSDGAIVS